MEDHEPTMEPYAAPRTMHPYSKYHCPRIEYLAATQGIIHLQRDLVYIRLVSSTIKPSSRFSTADDQEEDEKEDGADIKSRYISHSIQVEVTRNFIFT
jgi:hypothetical protein